MVRTHGIFRRILPWLLLLSCLTAAAQDISVDDLAKELNLRFFWDPFRMTGSLVSPEHSVTFAPGFPFLTVDSVYQLPAPDITMDARGMILFSPRAADAVRKGISREFHRGGPIISAVVLDPGHGGKDPGAVGTFTIGGETRRFFEKDVTLSVAKRLYGMLKQEYPDRQILLTREDDTYPTLAQRTEIANSISLEANEAMIFISIHVNASFNASASGYEIWYLPPDYRRNLLSPGDVEGVDDQVIPILNTMLEEEFTVESIILAKSIMEGMGSSLGAAAKSRGMKEESWFVVRNAKMPSVLIEVGFISNREEALRLQEPAYLQDMALGIYNGVRSFISGFENTKGFTE